MNFYYAFKDDELPYTVILNETQPLTDKFHQWREISVVEYILAVKRDKARVYRISDGKLITYRKNKL